jgi:hypothetical protein
VFAFVFCGALLGMYVRTTLPEGHLRDDVKDVVRLSTGLIGTIAALVLGLLIASAKSSYDARNTQIKQITSNVILLDTLLEQFGPDARDLRVMLRGAIGPLVDRIWAEGDNDKSAPFAATGPGGGVCKKGPRTRADKRCKTCSSIASTKRHRRFNTIAFGAVCSGARFASRALSCNPYFLARDHFCKLRPVCTA